MTVHARKLGTTGLTVGPVAFGGNVFGWTADEATSFKLLDACVAAGFNLIDTADVYSRWAPGNQGGESETVIGNWLKKTGNRDKVVIATKVGLDMGGSDKGLSRAYVLRAVERSLNRLQIDTIDLYQSHRDDGTPQEETLGAYAELIKQGKVRAIGASNYTADRLAESLRISKQHSLPAYQCLQPEYNLYDRTGFEAGLEPLCRAENIGVITYFSLAAGFLTGKYRSEADLGKSPRGAKVKNYLNDRGFRILAALDEVAGRYQSTPGRVALAWLFAKPAVTAPIASATSLEQFADLVEATKLELDAQAVAALDLASDHPTVTSPRNLPT
ncbi:aldo/keto reductase [Fimbriiglobus ruber]|uniref:Oxidoreductase n=1 Tax=Fimbriiglobus ruber TaxID=1908690 RepID=A0A225DUX5_9BACT|nr:aldo/keto reductase [Fimbriiglobus ruber]OWK42328.1 Oxidoreductase [Fimbriiglobus ruber]